MQTRYIKIRRITEILTFFSSFTDGRYIVTTVEAMRTICVQFLLPKPIFHQSRLHWWRRNLFAIVGILVDSEGTPKAIHCYTFKEMNVMSMDRWHLFGPVVQAHGLMD